MRFNWIKRFPSLLISLSFLLLALLLLVCSDAVQQGVSSGLQACVTVLIPSLFPFMVLSGILSASRATNDFQRLLAPVMHRVFHLPACAACTVLMGLIGGYPVGAKMTASLLDQGQIDGKTAGRLLCFCTNAGPSFLISAVGVGLLGNIEAGVLLLCCQWLSALLIGFFLGLCHRKEPLEESGRKKAGLPFPAALVQGVQSGIDGMLSVSGYVLLFSAIIELLFSFRGEQNQWILLIAGLLEVTTGCIRAASGANLVWIGFLVSFSGFSVFCQASSFFKGKKPPFFPFLCSRLSHGLITASLVKIGSFCFPEAAATVFSNLASHSIPHLSGSPIVSVLLLLLCAIFLCSLPEQDFRRLNSLF